MGRYRKKPVVIEAMQLSLDTLDEIATGGLMDARYLTYPDAATYLSTTVPALKKRVQLGELPVIRDGRRVRFDRHDLDTHMRRNRIEAWAS